MSGLVALLLLPTAGSCVAVPSSSPEASPSQIQHHTLLTASCSQLPHGVLGLPCLRSWHHPHSCPGLGITASLHSTALGMLQVTPKPLPCTQAAAAADPHLTLSGGSYLENDFVSRKMAAGLWGAHSLVAHLPGHQLMDIPEKSPKFDLETGLRVRVQHFTPGRGSSSVLNPLQFPRALRRKTGGWGEA